MDKTYQDIHILDRNGKYALDYRMVEISSIDFADESFVLHFKDGDNVYMIDVKMKQGMKLVID